MTGKGKKISDLGENRLIRRLAAGIRVDRSVLKGIGDDCAVLAFPGGKAALLASDMLVGGVHFRPNADPAAVGWKALAVNVSDVAAMAGTPRHAVISIGLPNDTPVAYVDGLYRGLRRCAARFGVNLVGGDTVRAPRVVIDVAILGDADRRRVVYRSGARPGDWILVTGRLGGAVRSGRHLTFTPRLREAQRLAAKAKLHALMDLSDGLWADLPRMCEASRIGAAVELARIPRRSGCSLASSLTEGEDFELLIAAAEPDAKRLLAWAKKNLRCGLTAIGCFITRTPGPSVIWLGPVRLPWPASLKTFQHFR